MEEWKSGGGKVLEKELERVKWKEGSKKGNDKPLQIMREGERWRERQRDRERW